LQWVIHFLATGAYAGYAPVASGTVGSLVAIPLALFFSQVSFFSPWVPALFLALVIAAACWVAGEAEKFLAEKDSGKIVIDEIVGFLVATFLLQPSLAGFLIAFLLFRLFDIVKPFPAGYLERHLKGGPGVVLDDVVAGIYSNLVVRILL
jgi:phosphatidylglycerophosphatase A